MPPEAVIAAILSRNVAKPCHPILDTLFHEIMRMLGLAIPIGSIFVALRTGTRQSIIGLLALPATAKFRV
jgi:hypothetical protein